MVDRATAAHRISTRLQSGSDPSDATPELIDALADRFEPWPTAVQLHTGESPHHTLERAIDAMGLVQESA